MQGVLLVSLVALVSAQQCPEFGEFSPWTQCLFFPLANISKGVAEACGTTFQKTKSGTGIPLPEGFKWPEKCGHCSFKTRCRKRDRKEGCYSLDLQRETCSEFGDICAIQKHPKIGCRYNLIAAAAKNCLTRPDVPEWRRDAIRRMMDGLPEGNCIDKDGQCKCCCHPYIPNAEGTACVMNTDDECMYESGPLNEWSKCLWYPVINMMEDFMYHCKREKIVKILQLPVPTGMNLSEKCGYCSFRARCSTRGKEQGCFHLAAEKKACGPDDCPTCGNVCTVEKINNSCDWGVKAAEFFLNKIDLYAENQPYWRRRGINSLIGHMPYRKCKEMNGQCKCCCYPYEVSEDGSKCELVPLCSFEPVH